MHPIPLISHQTWVDRIPRILLARTSVLSRTRCGTTHRYRIVRPSLVILDLLLPGTSGLEICRTIRDDSNVPIIIVTAKDSEADKIVGLEVGADDYVTKPFSMPELMS